MIKISLDNIITGVSLLFLAVCGNFIAETLSCNVLINQQYVWKKHYNYIINIFCIKYCW